MSTQKPTPTAFESSSCVIDSADTFASRHIGPSSEELRRMLDSVGQATLDSLSDAAIPASIRIKSPLHFEHVNPAEGEFALIQRLAAMAEKNQVLRSCIGMGYYDCITPPVIQRNILENPAWYTAYTPYQAEISQGRLEALLNFQTMVSDLTGLAVANASLLDEGTAAAEAMAMAHAISGDARSAFFVADDCHPQTIAVVRTRAESLGIRCVVGDATRFDAAKPPADLFGILLQYPGTDGRIVDYTRLIAQMREARIITVVATDLLALTLLKPPGELGADIAVGSTQRFGVPMGFGGPHAAFLATGIEHIRRMPGRIVGVSRDVHGNPALRLAIQTREQHIRREKATSNICTAQVLLAVIAGMYAVWHGPDGLKRIAQRIATLTGALAAGIRRIGHEVAPGAVFDTLRVTLNGLPSAAVLESARSRGYNLRDLGDGAIGISLDETSTRADVEILLESFAGGATYRLPVEQLAATIVPLPANLRRTSSFLTHPVFNSHHSETEMLRYINQLAARDLTLAQSMIPLGSCTMKLNATSEMFPITWPKFARLHPYAPADQTRGYAELFTQLESWLANISGMAAVSLQPNAGSQGEYAGLLAIRAYHRHRGEPGRKICLIPTSAHGTNPASAVIAGFTVVPVACRPSGDVDLRDLTEKAEAHRDDLACLMITYPSTHGVFDDQVGEICRIVHSHGGQVYMDGANMNAQVGLCRPGDIGADVCHLNLHKTFCIPHGGGGPGMGPIAVAEHLKAFLPGNPLASAPQNVGWASPTDLREGGQCPPYANSQSSVLSPQSYSCASAPYGSALILTIPWVYIALMGGKGLKRASQVAILNANYMAKRLGEHYPILFTGPGGFVAHEFVLDCRPLEASAGIKVEDIAKRLMDYGFHAPTMSWPVPGTLMIEPTESESTAELDRFCDAMISIRREIAAIEQGKADRADNVLKNAPHTAQTVTANEWHHPYGREQAAFPASWVRDHKFWPSVGRIDNPYGDRHLFCSCPPVSQ
ncbi:MAG: aminomethyl-transferring glycine dehydrogenase [Tepidisphaeraceae bacterium]|jgi:glycine dehydrogenase